MNTKHTIIVGAVVVFITIVALGMSQDQNAEPVSSPVLDMNVSEESEHADEGASIEQAGSMSANKTKEEKVVSKTSSFSKREVMITNGVKHNVPLDEILGGGPAKDGIPPIDDPKFETIAENKTLSDSEPGIVFASGKTARFYPFQILVWHEIVNDTIDGKRVLVTYCPLCLSGIVFDPAVNGERVEFGTSGKLWNSNLVMYDRKTDSYWSQVLGESIVGEMTGTKLEILSSDMVNYGDFKKAHPNGEVLSRKTGSFRTYGRDPYGDYYTTAGTVFPVEHKDNRLHDKAFVLGVVIDGKAKAYLPEAIEKVGEIEDVFAGKTLIVRHEEDINAVRVYEKKKDGSLERVNPFGTFWFSWFAVHPGTELYK